MHDRRHEFCSPNRCPRHWIWARRAAGATAGIAACTAGLRAPAAATLWRLCGTASFRRHTCSARRRAPSYSSANAWTNGVRGTGLAASEHWPKSLRQRTSFADWKCAFTDSFIQWVKQWLRSASAPALGAGCRQMCRNFYNGALETSRSPGRRVVGQAQMQGMS